MQTNAGGRAAIGPGGQLEARLEERIRSSVEKAQRLLGPDAVPDLPADGSLGEVGAEELVDRGVAELREFLESAGPKRLEAARLALELSDVRDELRADSLHRRVSGLSNVQKALSELRAVDSIDQIFAKATRTVCDVCGFERAVLFRVEGSDMLPTQAYSRADPEWDSKVKYFIGGRFSAGLDKTPLETEMLRRRAPAIVHDASRDPRVHSALTEVSHVQAYVAAPIMPEGRVIGFLHAAYGPDRGVDIIDRDILWAFAEGCGYALERTILLERLQEQRQQIQQLVRSTEAVVTEICEAEVRLSRTDYAGAAITSTATSIFLAPETRIYSLLTRRELEVVELMAEGETNKQIAARLVISEGTVKSHVKHILRKLRAANRAEAVSRYIRLTQDTG